MSDPFLFERQYDKVQLRESLVLIAAYCGSFENQEDGVDKDAHDGCKYNSGNPVREKERNLEGKDSIRQGKITANTADQDHCSNRQLFRIEEIDLL